MKGQKPVVKENQLEMFDKDVPDSKGRWEYPPSKPPMTAEKASQVSLRSGLTVGEVRDLDEAEKKTGGIW